MTQTQNIEQTATLAGIVAAEESLKRTRPVKKWLSDEARLNAGFCAAMEVIVQVLETKADAVVVPEWMGLTVISAMGHALAKEAP